MCKQPLGTNLDVRGSKFGFWGEKWFKHVKNCAELMFVHLSELERAVSEQLLEVFRLSKQYFAQAKCSLTEFLVLRSYVFFTHFCFELAFGVNTNVLDNFVRFPMDLV